jgi:hypothetical protein
MLSQGASFFCARMCPPISFANHATLHRMVRSKNPVGRKKNSVGRNESS